MSDQQTHPRVRLETSFGDITLELDTTRVPETANNFLAYVDDGHYDGTIFHRVIDGFMIQGGGFDERMQEKSTARDPIENQADKGSKNEKYSIAMARTNDPHSATAQFFINTEDTNSFLDHTSKSPRGWGYCVFGKVVDGQDVVDKIKKVQTSSRGMHQDVPTQPVVISKASRV